MGERDLNGLRAAAIAGVSEALLAAEAASDAESGLMELSRATFDLLGDRQAHRRPGALKDGEQQFFVSGFFLVSSDRQSHVLVAEHGFPPEQHRLAIPIALGHPGWVYDNQVPLILANTDQHPDFEQILETARMGSALYGPMIWRGLMIGQLVTAAQARDTFEEADLEILVLAARAATAVYVALDGPAFLNALDRDG